MKLASHNKTLAVWLAALVLGGTALSATSDPVYRASVEKWRADREAHLKADDGWLAVAGLFWLHEGENRFGSDPLNDIVLPARSAPAEAGSFDFHGGSILVHVKAGVPVMVLGKRVETARLRADSDPAFNGNADQIIL